MIATRKASQRGDPVGGRAGARAGRRLGRPRALDADADRRTAARVETRRLRRAQPALRHPRARHGRDRQRPRRCTASARSASTFFIFSDYMKGAIRLAALMRHPVDLRLHPRLDRPGRGRPDAPADRAARARCARMPNINVVRPGGRQRDRAGLAVRARADRDARPRSRSRRQGLPIVGPGRRARRRDRARRLRARATRRAASPTLILIGTGSEVHICNERRRAARGRRHRHARGVSMPCLDRFAEQDEDYRDSVLPPACARAWPSRRRARSAGHRWVGDDGDVDRHDDASARRRPSQGPLRALRLHPRERGRARHARSSSE